MQTICNTCGKPISNPWRVYGADGKVIMGCVSSAHNDQLTFATESATWHNRKDAKRIRAAEPKGVSVTSAA